MKNKIVWIGPMANLPHSRIPKDVLDLILKPMARDHNLEIFTANEHKESVNWFNELLLEINNSIGVFCDISYPSPNVYFELGYAFALRKSIFVVNNADENAVPSDLTNIQIFKYEVPSDVRGHLESWIKILVSEKTPFDDITKMLPYPINVIEGNGRHIYRYHKDLAEKSFVFEESYAPPFIINNLPNDEKLTKVIIEINGIQARIAKILDKPFFNGGLLGLVSFIPRRSEDSNRLGAKIKYRNTDYFTFTATHFYEDYLKQAVDFFEITEHDRTDLLKRIKELQNDGKWDYAKPLSITVFILFDFGGVKRITFQKRNMKMNFHAQYRLQATAAGMMHKVRAQDNEDYNVFTPELTFIHELLEETGLDVTKSEVNILGLVEELVNHEHGFVGFVELEGTKEIPKRLPIDSFESEEFVSIPFSPESLQLFIEKEAKMGKDIAPMSIAALYLLIVYKFGNDVANNIFALT